VRHDDTVGQTKFHKVEAEIKIGRMPLAEFTEAELLRQLNELAAQYAKAFSENFYSDMDRITAETGNVVDAKGQPLSTDHILEMIQKTDHDFDPDGNWRAPTILLGSVAMEKMLKLIKEGGVESEEFNQALKRILEKKRDDYRSREADRILAG